MCKNKYIVEKYSVGKRLDKFLIENTSNISRSKIQNMIKDSKVLVNDKFVEKNYKVRLHDVVKADFSYEEPIEIMPENIDLDIIYEDEYIAVINKAKGMNSQIDEHHRSGTLVNALMHRFKEISDIGGSTRLGIVHRLDKNTTGAIIICKNNIAYENLKLQFQERTVYKEYLAIVRGGFSQKSGTIDAPIGRNPKNRILMDVTYTNSKEAITHYEVLEEQGQFSFIKCILETGRTHQIRVHMKYIQHPILSDNKYGIKSDRNSPEHQYLHSHIVSFNHVGTGERIEVVADLPKYFKDKLREYNFTI